MSEPWQRIRVEATFIAKRVLPDSEYDEDELVSACEDIADGLANDLEWSVREDAAYVVEVDELTVSGWTVDYGSVHDKDTAESERYAHLERLGFDRVEEDA